MMFFSKPKPRRFIFVHMPRTGGTSLNRMIREGFAKNARKLKSYDTFHAAWLKGEWACLHGHVNWPDPRLLDKRTYVVCMLRHPVDRIISWYKYLEIMKAEKPDADMALAKTPREHRAALLEFATRPENLNTQAKIIAGVYRGAVPEARTNEMEPAHEALLEKARSNLASTRTILGTTENYTTFHRLLRDRYQWPISECPAHVGVSPSVDIALDDALRRILLEANLADFTLWQDILNGGYHTT